MSKPIQTIKNINANPNLTKGAGGRPSNPKRVAASARYAEIVKLRIDGHPLQYIADRYNLTAGRISQILTAEHARLAEAKQADMALLVHQELDRLDRMLVPYLKKAEDGNDRAAQVVLRIMERRAKLLGLDVDRTGEAVGSLADAVTDLLQHAGMSGEE